MGIRAQIVVAVIIVAALMIIINMIRKKALELRYALAWLAAGLGVLILDLFPGMMDRISKVMGIASPINMLFFVGFCFSLCIIFGLTVVVAKMSIRIKELSQELAIYEMKNHTK